MIRKTAVFSLCIALFLGVALSGESLPPESELTVTAEIGEAAIPLNRILPLVVRIEWSGGADRYTISSIENPAVTNFSVLSSSVSNRVEYRDGRQYAVRLYEFGLKPAELGMGYIESILVEYTEGDSGTVKRAMTQRLGVKITDPAPEPGEGSVLPFIIVGGALAVCAAAYFVWNRRRKKTLKTEEKPAEISPEEKALAGMRTAHENVSDFREGIAQLTRLLNVYLSEKFDISAGAMTIDDLMRTLALKGMDENSAEKVKEVAERSDALKFSGQFVDRGTYEMIFADITGIIEKMKNGRKKSE